MREAVVAVVALLIGVSGCPSVAHAAGPPWVLDVGVTASVPANELCAPGTCPHQYPPTPEEPVAYFASVRGQGPDAPMPTGTVDFDLGQGPIATLALIDGEAVLVVRYDDYGGRCMSIRYSGDVNYPPAQSASYCHSVGLTNRYAGADRIDTATLAADGLYPVGGAATAVLARDDGFADALAGGPLAVATGGVLLLNPSGGLDAEVADELQFQLEPGATVYLLGGTTALAPAVADAVTALGFRTVRLAGADRYETAVLVARDGIGDPAAFVLATGRDFPDALAGGPLAGGVHGAVLLTDGPLLPPAVASYLADEPTRPRTAVGGQAALADPTATPLVGSDRYETAVVVACERFPTATHIAVASGVQFPDALTGGADVGVFPGPLLLTDPVTPSQALVEYLQSRGTTIRGMDLFGGFNAISEQAELRLWTSISPKYLG